MGYTGATNLSSNGREHLFGGGWERVYAIVDPLAAATEVYLGQVNEGVFRTEREEVQFFTQGFPRELEVSAPASVTMSFTGTGYELVLGLAHFLVGDARIDDTGQYVYPGASCQFENIDVSFRAERVNCDSHMIVGHIHRARATGAFEVGSQDGDFVGTPIEVNALEDRDGDFGGSDAAPLGWFWFSNASP